MEKEELKARIIKVISAQLTAKYISEDHCHNSSYAAGWNDCLTKVLTNLDRLLNREEQ